MGQCQRDVMMKSEVMGREDAVLLILNMDKRDSIQQLFEFGKGKKMDSSLEPLGGTKSR